jgi:CheY-like chemotaxis protein
MTEALYRTETLGTLRRFAADVAHSCSNYMAAIVSNLNMARKSNNSPAATRFIGGASRSADRAIDFVDRLIGFARESRIDWDTVDIEALLQRIVTDEPETTREEPLPPLADAIEGNKTVLLVDDDPVLRAVASDALGSLGFEVVDVGTGEAALNIVRSGRQLRLMVVDLGMMPMNGLEVLRRARADRPNLRALVMAGHPDAPNDLDGFGDDTALLKKPFGIEELSSCIRRLID